MKNLLFYFLFAFSASIVSAQEITVAYITEPKSNAEWLRAVNEESGDSISFTESDLKVVKKLIRRLRVGNNLANVGIFLAPVLFTGGVLTTFQGAFTRMPAHRKLSILIKRKYPDSLLLGEDISDLNLKHLLAAKKELGKAQRVSNVAIVLTVANAIVTTYFIERSYNWDGLSYFGLGIIGLNLTNGIASYINMRYNSNAISELSQVH